MDALPTFFAGHLGGALLFPDQPERSELDIISY